MVPEAAQVVFSLGRQAVHAAADQGQHDLEDRLETEPEHGIVHRLGGLGARWAAELQRLSRLAVRSMSRRTTTVISSRLALGSRIRRVSNGDISGTGARAVILRTASVIRDMRG